MPGKKCLIFFILVFLFCAGQKVFPLSKTINSLCLDFTRTEDSAPTEQNIQQTGFMSGKIIYNKNPYLFIFQTFEPAQQILIQTQHNAYFLENDTITDFSENAQFISQICLDFLNWFKEDYGLSETFYAPDLIELKDGNTVSRWTYQKHDEHPIDMVMVYSDFTGRFTQLKMFLDMEAEYPVTQTSLFDFEYSAGCSYPTRIVSVSYEEGQPVLNTELAFSKIQFNNPVIQELPASISLDLSAADGSEPENISLPVFYKSVTEPSQKVYHVSIPSVIANASFKFYKKFITEQDMSACPFYPSCSQFMLEAVQTHGPAGFIMGLERLKRCTNTEHKRNLYPTLENGKHYDPVPPKNSSAKKGNSK